MSKRSQEHCRACLPWRPWVSEAWYKSTALAFQPLKLVCQALVRPGLLMQLQLPLYIPLKSL